MTQGNEYDWLEQLRAPAQASVQLIEEPVTPRGGGELWTLRSLSGGVGRSSLAINLAFEAARQGMSVCLVDLDSQNPGLHLWLNLPQAKTAVTAAVRLVAQQRLDSQTLDTLLVQIAARDAQVHLLSGGLANDQQLDLEALEVLLHLLASKYDLVVVDTAPGVNSELHRLIGRIAQRQFLVVPAEPVGLASLLSTQATSPSLQTATVLFNRVRSTVLGGNPQGQLEQVLARHSSLQVSGYLPLETEVFDLAQHRGVPLRSVNGRSKALAALTAVLGGRDRAWARRRARG